MQPSTEIGLNINVLAPILSTVSPSMVIWAIFFAAVAFFVVFSLLLVYHWLRYGFTSVLMLISMGIYFVGGVGLLSVMLVAAASF